jgi:transposase
MVIPLRGDFDADRVRAAAKRSKDGLQARRLLGLAAIYEGARRVEAAKIGGVTLQIIRDWVLRFNAQGPEGLVDRKAPGQPSRLNEAHRAALAAILERGPLPAVHGIVRWRIVDLCQWIWEEHRGIVAKQTLSRDLRNMGYRRLSARPRHHAQAEGAIEDFKKASPRAWKKSGAKKGRDPGAIELGSPTRRGSARRTRSPAVGPGAARARALQSISKPLRPTFLARSARTRERARRSSCLDAPPRR